MFFLTILEDLQGILQKFERFSKMFAGFSRVC